MIQQEISEKSQDVAELENNLKILLLPKDANDEKSVIMEIRAGAGGEEAALFAHSLVRMYTCLLYTSTLGEVWVGGAKGYTDVIGVTLGTGVGGGILTGGRLLEGARGLGGELGHYRTHALDGVLCTCGASGCWERYAATTAQMCIRDRCTAEPGPRLHRGRLP